MANLGRITAQGVSGAQYQLGVYSMETTFKPLGGVYCFLCGNDPVYVGITGDLSTRFSGHHKESEILRHRADRIAILLEQDEQRRLQIERDLLKAYRWKCNG